MKMKLFSSFMRKRDNVTDDRRGIDLLIESIIVSLFAFVFDLFIQKRVCFSLGLTQIVKV